MPNDPYVNRITIYPVKGLDGMNLQNATIVKGGCLMHDREYAISDEEGNFIVGKTNPLIHSLRSAVDFESGVISLRPINESEWHHFHLQKERNKIQNYLSEYFGIKTILHQDATGRFLDIPDFSGATVLSTETLKTVTDWFEIKDLEETRRRFRATIELDGVPAFWEDRLFNRPGVGIKFKVGDVLMIGVSPRARCVVPTRNPENGEVIHAFPKTFARHRAATVPEWSTLNEYDHHYYLSVDCFIPETEVGKEIGVGDGIEIVG